MMARHWTESGDTAVRLAAALDYEDGGQRLRELAARLDRTQAGLSGGARRACARPSSRATSRDHGPSGGRDERRRVTPVPADGVGDGAHYVVTTDEQRRGRAGRTPGPGAPVGRVDGRVPEEGKHGGELGVEVRSEALGIVERRGHVDEATETREQAATHRGQAVVGQLPVVAAVAQGEPGLQDGCHVTGPGAVGMVVPEILATPEQVRHAGLVQCVIEAPIGRPSVAHEYPVEVGPEDGV